MQDNESILDNLRYLGLTRTQARIYIASLAMKSATAKQIAELAGLDVAVAYRKIRELLTMNLLELHLDSPNRYMAIQPDKALKGLLEKSEADLKYRKHLVGELQLALVGLTDQASGSPEATAPRVAYRLLIGRNRLFEESRRLRNRVNNELLLIIPALGLRRLVRHGYMNEVTACVRRGVAVRIVTEITDMNTLESGQLASLVSVRHYPKISFRLGVYDREVVHIGAAYDDDPLSDGSKDVYLIIADKALASSMALLFEGIWERSVRPTPILKKFSMAAIGR